MKAVTIYINEADSNCYAEPSTTSYYIGIANDAMLNGAEEQATKPASDLQTVLELAKGGMSAEDIAKLKHAGVI